MFGYEILRNRWAILALFIGAALVLLSVLFFLDYRMPRKKKADKPDEYEENHLSAWEGIPWSIKVLIFIIAVYGISYSIYSVINPNSW